MKFYGDYLFSSYFRFNGTFNSTHSEFDIHTGLFGTPKVLRADNIVYDRSPLTSDAFVPATEANRSQLRTFIKNGVLYVTELSGLETIEGSKEVLKFRYYVSTYSLKRDVFSEVRNGFIYFETYNEPLYIFYTR